MKPHRDNTIRIGDIVDIYGKGSLPMRGTVRDVGDNGKVVSVRLEGGVIATYPGERCVRVG